MDDLAKEAQQAGLRRGGQGIPGGWPGSGRPKSEVVEACKEAFDKRIPLLTKIADDEKLDVKRRLEAINLLGRYGLGTIVTHEVTNEQVLYILGQIVAEIMPSKANEFVTKARLALSLMG